MQRASLDGLVVWASRIAPWVLAALAGLPAVAAAQTVYNADGTPAQVYANEGPDGGAYPNWPGADPGAPPLNVAPAEAQVAAPVEERFDVDCDPDIEVCVDPNTTPLYDDGYDPNAYQQFQDTLSPYGSWNQDPSYGYVWTPAAAVVGDDFLPYSTGGQWVASTDYGFTWVSDWDWGWAPFHYGRWLFISGLGWSWIPGTIWGPAWVDWRCGGGYVGWAPLPPAGVIVPPPARALGQRNPWRFALSTELFRRNPTFLPHAVVPSIYAKTAPVQNFRTVAFGNVHARISLGPELATVSRDLGRPVPALALRNAAPSVLPRANVVARPGVGLSDRNYVRSVPPQRRNPVGIPAVPVHNIAPRADVPSPRMSAPPAYPLGRTYSPTAPAPSAPYYAPAYPAQQYRAPAYTPPAQQYRAPAPSYTPPVQQYHAPAYSPPVQQYRAPVYTPPVQQYHAPVYAPPVQQYRAPVYTPPVQQYHAPAPSYSPPVHSAPPSFSPSVQRPSAPSPSFAPSRRH